MYRLARGSNCVKYYFSHLLHYCLKMKSGSLHWVSILPFLGSVPEALLIVALGFGLYVRFDDAIIMIFSVLGLFVFSISIAFVYYFSIVTVGKCLIRLWIGCLLGVIAFTSKEEFASELPEQAMSALLVVSVGVHFLWNIAQRLAHLPDLDTGLIINNLDCIEMLGMVVACNTQGRDFVSVSLLVVAFAFSLISIRLKSYIAVLNLLCLISITSSVYFSQLLSTHVSPYPLVCFAGRMMFAPILDLYFSKLTMLEHWQGFLAQSKVVHRLMILFVISIELAFYSVVAKHTPSHKEWYVVVPIFATFSIIWFCYHIVFIITCWQLGNKIADCNATYWSLSKHQNMGRIMAAKGVRHFGLITERLTLVTFLTTVVLAAVGWETKTALSMSLLFVVLPLELSVMSLLWQLGSVLGGTCIGYAIVAPAVYHRPGDAITVLPTSAMQELSNRATRILNTVQRFFSFHLIDNYGCDYSSSGLTLSAVESKLRSFLQKQTADGPRFDTYLVYYSGHVHNNGDWALAEDSTMKFETLLEWWQEYNSTSGARLVLVLDSVYSHQWLRQVSRLHDDYVAVQTCKIRKSNDPEITESFRVGDFTSDWIEYNCGNASEVNWSDKEQQVMPVYGVSRCWTDFTFHLPTQQDIAEHWHANFPRVTQPLIRATNFPHVGSMSFCCDCLLRCIKRKRMHWLPPMECDTGHGFTLIRS